MTNLLFWVVLLLYSAVCQTTALTFVCTPYYDQDLLVSDPSLVCGEPARLLPPRPLTPAMSYPRTGRNSRNSR